jgi:hypothetical protein
MFVTVSIYRAKAGEEDAIIALHEDWQTNQRLRARGYVSGELLLHALDQRLFFDIARFESEAAARSLADDPEQASWYQRLTSLAEAEPISTNCESAWQGN